MTSSKTAVVTNPNVGSNWPGTVMIRLTIILVFVLQSLVYGQSLTGQVFIVAQYFSEDNCEAYAECDCCSSDLYFLTGDKFCFVSKCISGDTFYRGTYTTKANKLILTFDKKFVTELTDEEYNIVGLETKEDKIDIIEFDIRKCGQKLRLTNPTNAELSNGSRYEQKRETELNKRLMTSKPWRELSK
jgi:hypothetical protein